MTLPTPVIIQAPPPTTTTAPAPVIIQAPPATGTTTAPPPAQAAPPPGHDDASLQAKVDKAFGDDPQISAANIDATVVNGRVRLVGTVGSEAVKQHAERVAYSINTPFGVIKDTASGTYWLGGGKKVWYSATDAKGPWTAGGTPPDDILKMAPADTASARADTSTARADTSPHPPPPVIVTATEPTELVVTQGPPKWQTTAGGRLPRA